MTVDLAANLRACVEGLIDNPSHLWRLNGVIQSALVLYSVAIHSPDPEPQNVRGDEQFVLKNPTIFTAEVAVHE